MSTEDDLEQSQALKLSTADDAAKTDANVVLAEKNAIAASKSAKAAAANSGAAIEAKAAALEVLGLSQAILDEIRLRGDGIVRRGNWSNVENYLAGDWVIRNGAAYIAKIDNIGIIPGDEGSEGTWDVVISAGPEIESAVAATSADRLAVANDKEFIEEKTTEVNEIKLEVEGLVATAGEAAEGASASETAAGLAKDTATTAAGTAVASASAAAGAAGDAVSSAAAAEAARAIANTRASAAEAAATTAIAAADGSGFVVRGTFAELDLVSADDDTAGRVLQGAGAGDYMREGGIWTLKRAASTSFRIFTTALATVLTIDAAGYLASASVQATEYAADKISRAPLVLFTTSIDTGTVIDATGHLVSVPLSADVYRADVSVRKSLIIFTTGLPANIGIDSAGAAVNIPVQKSEYDAQVTASRPFRIFMTSREPSISIDAEGNLVTEPVQKSVYDADLERRKSFRLYTTFAQQRVSIDAAGTKMPTEAAASGGGGSGAPATVEVSAWDEGTGYEADQSFLMPLEDVMYLFIASGQSYNNGAAGGDPNPAYNLSPAFPSNPGLALMPSVGVKPDGASFSSFAEIVATNSVEVKEPYIVEAINDMVGRALDKFGTSVPMIGAIAARGGWNYYRLKRGSTIFTELERVIMQCNAIAVAAGYRLVVNLFIGLGESDNAAHTDWQAYSDILQWREDVEAAAKKHTGQHERVQAFFYSANRGAPTGTVRAASWQVATRKLALDYPHLFTLYGPSYAVETTTDSHPSVRGYRTLGKLGGRAAFSAVFGTGRRPCDVLRYYATSTTTARAEIYLPDDANLVRDESGDQVGYPTDPGDPAYIGPASGDAARDGGWFIRDKDGLFGVESAVVSGNNINFTFSRAFHPGSTRLMYAIRPQSGNTGGSSDDCARGIFRGDVSMLLPGDSGKPIYDWLVPQELFL